MFDEILYFLGNILQPLKDFGLWLLGLLGEVLKSIFYFFFDALCTLIEWLFSLIDFKNELFDISLGWTSLPDELIWLLNQVGIDNGLVIISAALLIRLTLNLIPSWGTRV